MAVQVPDQHHSSRWRRKRLVLISVATIILVGVAAIWVINVGNLLSNVLGIVFTLLGILITFLQWPQQPHVEVQTQVGEIASREQSQHQLCEQVQGMTLGLSKHKGALVIYAKRDLRGSTINLNFGFHGCNPKIDIASGVVARRWKGGTAYIAVFPSLGPGNYTVHTDSQEFVTKVSILPERVAEVD